MNLNLLNFDLLRLLNDSQKSKLCICFSRRCQYHAAKKILKNQDYYFWNIESVCNYNNKKTGLLIIYLPLLPHNPFIDGPLKHLKSLHLIKFYIEKCEYNFRKVYFKNISVEFLPNIIIRKILVILTTQRTGSTYLSELISNTHLLGYPQEYLLNILDNIKIYQQIPINTLYSFLTNRMCSPNGIASIKIMVDHLLRIKKEFKYIYNHICNINIPIEIIHLFRNSKIEQSISLVYAQESNIWHSTQIIPPKIKHFSFHDEELPIKKIPTYSKDQIKKNISILTKQDQLIQNLLYKLPANSLKISYERLCSNQTGTIKQISLFTGINIDECNIHIVHLKKYSSFAKIIWKLRYKLNDFLSV